MSGSIPDTAPTDNGEENTDESGATEKSPSPEEALEEENIFEEEAGQGTFQDENGA